MVFISPYLSEFELETSHFETRINANSELFLSSYFPWVMLITFYIIKCLQIYITHQYKKFDQRA